MKTLISGQTLDMDDHGKSQKSPYKWGRGLHIHKKMNSDRFCGATIRIPIDNDQKLDIIIKCKKGESARLRKEIRKAFSDDITSRNFARDMIETIVSWEDNKVDIKHIEDAANRIAKHFDLKEEVIKRFTKYIKEEVQYVTTLHNDEENNLYSITQSKRRIIAGEINLPKVCPNCGKKASNYYELENLFGFRAVAHKKIPQSWCRECRKI